MQPAFIDIDGRRLFCLRFATAGAARRVLVLPPFAEEMNKSRRLLAETARALADDGCDVLLPDLFGTGDSVGDFGDADWQTWCGDVAGLAAWHRTAAPQTLPSFLAVRSGALLLPAALVAAGGEVLCWQPVLDGARFLQQFLRLRVMASKFAGGDESLATLQATLDGGETLEVAGYALSAALADGIGSATLSDTALAGARRVTLLDIRPGQAQSVSVPLSRLVDALTARGVAASAVPVAAEQFWMTQEVAAPAAVLARTRAVFGAGNPHG